MKKIVERDEIHNQTFEINPRIIHIYIYMKGIIFGHNSRYACFLSVYSNSFEERRYRRGSINLLEDRRGRAFQKTKPPWRDGALRHGSKDFQLNKTAKKEKDRERKRVGSPTG